MFPAATRTEREGQTLPWGRWREHDVQRTAQPMPPVFGIAERALRLLGDLVAEGRIRSQSGQVRAAPVEHLAVVGAATDVGVAR